jgi:SAM-dependent methyltransferase
VTADETWLAAVWPFVRDNLPAPPAAVVEIGCGPLGGFVPDLQRGGYVPIGIDPEAPEGPQYRRVEFERDESVGNVDAIVACTSLHHVSDLGDVLAKVWTRLAPEGVLVIVEWARELFDEATAQWCFDRLPASDDDEHRWLHERRREWHASGEPWEVCLRGWAERERMHTGEEILQELDALFDCRLLEWGPYFFPELDGVDEGEERDAIDAGLIRATRVQYVGTPR